MDFESPEVKTYLFELYTMTNGDTQAEVSMYEVGDALGLEKTDAGTMAEDLFIQGLAELKTLSGGIGITRLGMEALDVEIAPEPGSELLQLGKEAILDDTGRESVKKILQDIKSGLVTASTAYSRVEETVMDIKTIEVQMLSPNPKTEIIREVLRSIHQGLTNGEAEETAAKLKTLIAS